MKNCRINEVHTTNEGYKIKIIEYFNSKNCTVRFYDIFNTTLKNISYCHIIKKALKNPNHSSICNVGYMGIGKYSSRNSGKPSRNYKIWKSMIERGYDSTFKNKCPTYKDTTVCVKWYNFQNFAKWYEENWKPYMEGWQLDKDILIKGNKIYSPETCCFVPVQINILLIKGEKVRGDLPIGVRVLGNSFQTRLNKNGKSLCLGTFNTPEEAFEAYKIAKEAYIKEVADKWRGQITDKVYQALINYKVEIDD